MDIKRLMINRQRKQKRQEAERAKVAAEQAQIEALFDEASVCGAPGIPSFEQFNEGMEFFPTVTAPVEAPVEAPVVAPLPDAGGSPARREYDSMGESDLHEDRIPDLDVSDEEEGAIETSKGKSNAQAPPTFSSAPGPSMPSAMSFSPRGRDTRAMHEPYVPYGVEGMRAPPNPPVLDPVLPALLQQYSTVEQRIGEVERRMSSMELDARGAYNRLAAKVTHLTQNEVSRDRVVSDVRRGMLRLERQVHGRRVAEADESHAVEVAIYTMALGGHLRPEALNDPRILAMLPTLLEDVRRLVRSGPPPPRR